MYSTSGIDNLQAINRYFQIINVSLNRNTSTMNNTYIKEKN